MATVGSFRYYESGGAGIPKYNGIVAEVVELWIADRQVYEIRHKSPVSSTTVLCVSVRSVGPLNRTSLHEITWIESTL